jgi:hypothetical protein
LRKPLMMLDSPTKRRRIINGSLTYSKFVATAEP